YNLSISHGISSIIIFLSLSYYLNINKHKIKKMINGAVNYIISNELEMKNTALFPNMIFKDYNNIIIKRRLAWCYGDLDIAISLWHAGNALNNQIWKNKSLQIFRSCIELVEEQDLLTEFGICHGTSGIAMIFRRIYLETEELLFKSGYELWFDKTIKKINEWAIENRERSEKKDFSLLTGLSGILLVIMSIVYNDNQKWDSLFLLS
ncbi:lanthionine synthetase LanC family protein, partial [Parabacteroides merdae]